MIEKLVRDTANSRQTAQIKNQAKKVFNAGKKEGLEKSKNLRVDLARGPKAISKELEKIACAVDQ